MQNVYNKLF